MEWLVILVAVGVAAALAVLVLAKRSANRRQRQASKERAQAPRPFPSAEQPSRLLTPETLGYKDMVVIGNVAYDVYGVIILEEDGFRWKEFWLEGAGSKVWLSVERDTELEVIQWTEVEIDLRPGEKKLTYNGAVYTLEEDGKAEYEALGTTGLPRKGSVRYYDYRSADDSRLSFERFDKGDWEAAEGFVLLEGMYELHLTPRH